MDQASKARLEADIVATMPALCRFARSLRRDHAGDDDLVQETLVKALGALEQFQPGTSLKSWLFTIMKNTFCTRFQRSKREPAIPSDMVEMMLTTPPTQEWHLRGQELERVCGNLRGAYRETFQYVFIDGKSYEDAADHFSCAVGTVKSRVNRARSFIATSLGESEASDPPS
jgi:RNA polymerase sigma factor (sigma-70 family)